MLDAHVLGTKDHSDNVEAEGIAGHLVAGNPNLRGTDELSLFAPPYLRDWAAEIERFPGLYLYECYCALRAICRTASGNQIDVAMTVPEALLRYLPSMGVQPPRRDAFATKPHCLFCL
jgi:hypothetical protein